MDKLAAVVSKRLSASENHCGSFSAELRLPPGAGRSLSLTNSCAGGL